MVWPGFHTIRYQLPRPVEQRPTGSTTWGILHHLEDQCCRGDPWTLECRSTYHVSYPGIWTFPHPYSIPWSGLETIFSCCPETVMSFLAAAAVPRWSPELNNQHKRKYRDTWYGKHLTSTCSFPLSRTVSHGRMHDILGTVTSPTQKPEMLPTNCYSICSYRYPYLPSTYSYATGEDSLTLR